MGEGESLVRELVEALKEAREFVQPFMCAEALYDRIEAAIAKAEAALDPNAVER